MVVYLDFFNVARNARGVKAMQPDRKTPFSTHLFGEQKQVMQSVTAGGRGPHTQVPSPTGNRVQLCVMSSGTTHSSNSASVT